MLQLTQFASADLLDFFNSIGQYLGNPGSNWQPHCQMDSQMDSQLGIHLEMDFQLDSQLEIQLEIPSQLEMKLGNVFTIRNLITKHI